MKTPTAKTRARKEGKHERVRQLVNNLLAEQRMFDDNKPVLTSRTFPGSDRARIACDCDSKASVA